MYPEISHELRNQNSLNFLTCKTLKTLYNKNKHPVSFRTQNFVVSLKTAYIEGSLPKWQLLQCSTLWCNRMNKHRLHRFRSTPAWSSSAHRFTQVGVMREANAQVQTIKMALKTRWCDAVPSCEKKTVFELPSFWSQTASVRTPSFCSLHFTADLFTNKVQLDDFQKDWN